MVEPTPNEIIQALTQRMHYLEQRLSTFETQVPTEPSHQQDQQSTYNTTSTDMMEEEHAEDNQLPLTALHSLNIRPSYIWSPTESLTTSLALDSPLFPPDDKLLMDKERRTMIERYPQIDRLNYNPPDALPAAANKMNKYQVKQDRSLKHLQYLLAGVVRPLDVLGLEISEDENNGNMTRYLYMLKDCRTLLLNVSAQVNNMRNNLAFQAINPHYSSQAHTSNRQFTMPPAAFQAALVEQTTTAQALKNASNSRNKKRNNHNNSQPPAIPPQQFFRSGPSSQQGGSTTNYHGNNPHGTFFANNNPSHSTTNNKPRANPNNPYRNKPPQQH